MHVTVIILPVDANSAKPHLMDLLANALTKERGLVVVILHIAKMLQIRFVRIRIYHSVPVSKELEIARDIAAMIVTVTTPLVDVKWSPLLLPTVPVNAHTKELGHAVDTLQLVKTRLHDTVSSQIKVLSHAIKEEEIAEDTRTGRIKVESNLD